MADDYDASSSRTYYAPTSSNQLARVWSVDKWVQDAVAAGFLDVFEGAGSDPTALSGYSTNKLWMRVPATGVTSAAAEVRKWNGQSPASALSNWPLASNLLTPIIINGDAGWPQTSLEIAANVTPTNTAYPPGDIRRYGADPTGISSSHAAFANACKTGHLVLGGGSYTYLLSTSPGVLTTSVVFDGQGCTIKTSGNVYCFYRNQPSATASVTISSGATEGSRTITCASTTGLVVGQICHIDTAADDHPPSFNTIVAINPGTGVVTLERQLRHTYTGTLSLSAWTPSLFLDRFEVRNTTFDGALSTSAFIGEAIRACGYRRAVLENCTFKDWSGSTSVDTRPVVFTDCLDMVCRGNRSEGQDNQSIGVASVTFYACGTVECSGNSHEGHAFGYEPIRCDHARLSNNSLIGLARQEFDDSEAAQSVRGIKAILCGNVTVTGNTIEGYESGLKIDDNFSATITGNTVRAALGRTYAGQVALNCAFSARTQAVLTISGNTVEGCDGVGIAVSYAGAGIIEPTITGNVVRNAQGAGIFINNARPTITGNTISDWGLRNSSDPAIYHGDLGGTIVGNSFRHATLTLLPCIRDAFGTGYNWEIDDNVSLSGNPCLGKGSVRTLASASAMGLGGYPERNFVVTGTTTIDSMGGAMPGVRTLRFTDALTLTYGASTIITPSGSNMPVAAGDVLTIQNETGSAGRWRVLSQIPAATLRTVGLDTRWVPATDMTPRTTNGAAVGTAELATNDIMLPVLDFDQTTEEGVGFWWSPPRSWNRGTVTFAAHWTAASGTGGVAWGLAAYAFSDDDAIDTAVSGQQIVTDTLIATNDMHVTSTSAAITIGGSPAAGDAIYFELTREVGNGSDTLNDDARLIGIRLFYTTNAATDA